MEVSERKLHTIHEPSMLLRTTAEVHSSAKDAKNAKEALSGRDLSDIRS